MLLDHSHKLINCREADSRGGESAPLVDIWCAPCRGVLLLERSEVLSFGSQALSAVRQTRDVGSAFWTLLLTQTWLTVFTCIMTIVSIAFFSYGERSSLLAICAGAARTMNQTWEHEVDTLC